MGAKLQVHVSTALSICWQKARYKTNFWVILRSELHSAQVQHGAGKSDLLYDNSIDNGQADLNVIAVIFYSETKLQSM